MREAGLVEVLPVQAAVVVPPRRDGCGEEGAGSVEGLVDVVQVALARDFFDQNGS